MTVSEANVAAFLCNQGFSVQRIPEATEERPDYWIVKNNFRAAVEVKEISENDFEKALRREVEAHRQAGVHKSRDDSKTIRHIIKKASAQLKKLCTDGEPGILIIQDIRPFWTKSFWIEESLKQAMFGELVIWRTAPQPSIALPAKTVATQFGRNKSNTDEKNRSVSAIGILHQSFDPEVTTLNLYHNPFAKNKLTIKFPNPDKTRQFFIDTTAQYGKFVEKQ